MPNWYQTVFPLYCDPTPNIFIQSSSKLSNGCFRVARRSFGEQSENFPLESSYDWLLTVINCSQERKNGEREGSIASRCRSRFAFNSRSKGWRAEELFRKLAWFVSPCHYQDPSKAQCFHINYSKLKGFESCWFINHVTALGLRARVSSHRLGSPRRCSFCRGARFCVGVKL